MTTPQQLAEHIRQVHFGGNWTSVNLKDTLEPVNWRQANAKVPGLNTIAALVFHMNYYFKVVNGVLNGGPVEGNDKFSFDCPPISTAADWESLVAGALADAGDVAGGVELLPEDRLQEPFGEEKYGTYHRNLMGLIEHTHYHLGQVTLIKKLVSGNGL